MVFRTIGIFIVAGIITIVSARLFHIPAIDFVILTLVISPIALLQMSLNKFRAEFMYTGSIFFRKAQRFIQLVPDNICDSLLYKQKSDVKMSLMKFKSGSCIWP